MRGERGASRKAGGPGVVAAHKRHARGKGPTQGLGAKGTRGAHEEHVAHVRDAGGVEAQRLVEGPRGLPSRREGMRCRGGEVRAGRREGLLRGGGTQAACTCGCGPTQGLGAKGTRGAHVEHGVHGRDAGGVEAQRLVEGRRLLPSRREGMRCRGERGASREAGGPGVVAAHKRHARGTGPTQGLGAKGTRGAHPEHVEHGRDAGGVEAQRLVEGRRALPSRRERMRCGGERCEPGSGRARGVVAARQAACTGPDSRLGGQGHARSAR
jgi:hypothetical protein